MNLKEQFKTLLNEANVNSLSTILQREWSEKYNVIIDDYNKLTDKQKSGLQEYISDRKKEIEKQINEITNNPQYISWIYNLLSLKKLIFPEDIDKTKSVLLKYTKIKLSELFPKEYKNILEFKSFGELFKIVSEYSKELSSGNRVIDFGNNEVVYNQKGIKIVKLMKYNDCDYLTKDTGWCIQQENYFNHYKPPFYMIVQNDKKIALLHLESQQFKDIHDEPIKEMDENLTNVMLNFLNQNKISINDLVGDLHVFRKIDSDRFYKFFVKDLITDGTYKGDIILVNLGLTKLPEWLSYIKVVDGDFKCYNNKLTDLEYIPEIINGAFDIHGNVIKDFQQAPLEIKGDYFDCSSNAISSLNGFPKLNDGVTMNLNNNLLKSLLGGLPNKAFYFNCSQNYLKSLEGSPTKITINYDCSDNKLHSLRYAPLEVGGGFNCEQNYLENLDYIPVIFAYSATEKQSISNYRVQQQFNNKRDFSNQEIRDAIEKSVVRNKTENKMVNESLKFINKNKRKPMKTRDYLNITDDAPINENDQLEQLNAIPSGKTVVKKEKRYTSYADDDGYDEEDFYKRDSSVEYDRSVTQADEYFEEVGNVTYKYQDKFWNNFPVVDERNKKQLKEAYRAGSDEYKTFMINHADHSFTLVNHDNEGTIFENTIIYDESMNSFLVECNDSECFNIIQNIGRSERYKHRLRSKEFGYIHEFAQMVNMPINVKYGEMSLKLQ